MTKTRTTHTKEEPKIGVQKTVRIVKKNNQHPVLHICVWYVPCVLQDVVLYKWVRRPSVCLTLLLGGLGHSPTLGVDPCKNPSGEEMVPCEVTQVYARTARGTSEDGSQNQRNRVHHKPCEARRQSPKDESKIEKCATSKSWTVYSSLTHGPEKFRGGEREVVFTTIFEKNERTGIVTRRPTRYGPRSRRSVPSNRFRGPFTPTLAVEWRVSRDERLEIREIRVTKVSRGCGNLSNEDTQLIEKTHKSHPLPSIDESPLSVAHKNFHKRSFI